MKFLAKVGVVTVTLLFADIVSGFCQSTSARPASSSPLPIPPALTGTMFNLEIQDGVTQFYPGVNTPTFGFNGPLLGPTLVLEKWDWVTMNVTNSLTGFGNSTTVHWHGLHVPAEDDGGPHQIIDQGTTWSPQFQVLNEAGTYWYHPHGENKTDRHVSKGLAGLIIIHDSSEAALALPRTYGTDDFPLVLQTKCFDVFNQIAIATAFDTVPMVNGAIDPYLDAPAQVVRLRLLNGASERTFFLGFSNGMNFQVIATDGGLLETPVTMNRLRLSNGERAEILLDLSSYLNDTIFLMSYGSELPKGVMGADSVGDQNNQVPDYYLNFLNGEDFSLLQLNVVSQTGNPVTSIPSSLVSVSRWPESSADEYRTFVFDTLSDGMMNPNLAEGPFGINARSFNMDSINEVVYLNSVEVWTLVNKTMVAHPFHIHDIQFFVLDVNGVPVADEQAGRKDVVLVMPQDTLRLITKFEDFSNDSIPYMYHCHVLHHEDDGMMGSFLVVDTLTGIPEGDAMSAWQLYPNPSSSTVMIPCSGSEHNKNDAVFNSLGEELRLPASKSPDGLIIDVSALTRGVYFLRMSSGNQQRSYRFIKN